MKHKYQKLMKAKKEKKSKVRDEYYIKNIKHGKWTEEEKFIFEELYKRYAMGEMTKQEVKSGVSTRTYQQVTSHWTKIKYHLNNKFSCLQNPHQQKEIEGFSKFYEQREDIDEDDMLVPLTDVNMNVNIKISYRLLKSLKEFAGNNRKVFYNDNIGYHILKMEKSEREWENWMNEFDKNYKRYSFIFLEKSLNTLKSTFLHF